MGQWTIKAKVRIISDTNVANVDPGDQHRYRAGTELEMFLRGGSGKPLADAAWWSSLDIDGAYILRSNEVEVIDLLGPAWMKCAKCGTGGEVKANEAGERYLTSYWDRPPAPVDDDPFAPPEARFEPREPQL